MQLLWHSPCKAGIRHRAMVAAVAAEVEVEAELVGQAAEAEAEMAAETGAAAHDADAGALHFASHDA